MWAIIAIDIFEKEEEYSLGKKCVQFKSKWIFFLKDKKYRRIHNFCILRWNWFSLPIDTLNILIFVDSVLIIVSFFIHFIVFLIFLRKYNHQKEPSNMTDMLSITKYFKVIKGLISSFTRVGQRIKKKLYSSNIVFKHNLSFNYIINYIIRYMNINMNGVYYFKVYVELH